MNDMTRATPTLSPYEILRLERIRRNEERLSSLGLLDDKLKPKKKTPSPRKKALPSSTAIATPTRTSRRLKRQPVLYEPILEDVRIPMGASKTKRVERRPATSKFRCEIPSDVYSSPLTAKQEALINNKMEGDFLGKFEDYLTDVDVLSERNRQSVMRQVTKLAEGKGIRYESKQYGWPEGCYFMRGKRITPVDDILKLMEIGRQCEEEWGIDRGNGWLLSHPLKKIFGFQQYHLQGEP